MWSWNFNAIICFFLVLFFSLETFSIDSNLWASTTTSPASLYSSTDVFWLVQCPAFLFFLKSRLCPQCQNPFLLIELKILSYALPVEHSQERCFVLVLRLTEDPLTTTALFWTLTPKKKQKQNAIEIQSLCERASTALAWMMCVCVISCRQHLTPCEAELTLSGHEKIKSTASNYWLGHMIQRTNHVFTGGLPQKYPFNQVSLDWRVSWLPYVPTRCVTIR